MASRLDEMTGQVFTEGDWSSQIEGNQPDNDGENNGKEHESWMDSVQERPAIHPPKRRGRPPKAKPLVPALVTPAPIVTERALEETLDEKPKHPLKRRGRPRKNRSTPIEIVDQPLGEDIFETASRDTIGDNLVITESPVSRLHHFPHLSNASPLVSAQNASTFPTHLLAANLIASPGISAPTHQKSSEDIIVPSQEGIGMESAAEIPSTPSTHSQQVPHETDGIFPALRSSTLNTQPLATAISTDAQDETYLDTTMRNKEPRKKYNSTKKALFTSNDQLQRAAGISGVYFELPDLYPKNGGAVGRPKKQKMALFKSERLKAMTWMRAKVVQNASASNQASVIDLSVETSNVLGNSNDKSGLLSKRKHDEAFENHSDSKEPKRPLIEVARNFGRIPAAPYQSPYQSSYISPYQQETSVISGTRDRHLTDFRPIASPHDLLKSLSAENRGPLLQPAHCSATELQEDATTWTSKGMVMPSQTQEPLQHGNEPSQNLQDERLEKEIQSVADFDFPDVAFKLPASKDSVAGNLCLSADKKMVEFIPGKDQADALILRIKITDIVTPPQVSLVGVLPVELQIYTRNANTVKSIDLFRCLSTEDGYQAANNMRAKITTAMTILGLSDDSMAHNIDALDDSEKPFKCDGCGGRWKNMGGLIYHQTKSKKSCNPNYVSQAPASRPRKSRPSLEPHAATEDFVGDASSLLNEKIAQINRHKEHDAISIEVAGADLATSNLLVVPGESDRTSAPSSKPAGLESALNHKAQIHDVQMGKETIMELLEANEDVFPGEKGLWLSYVAAWLQKSPKSGLPSYKVYNSAIGLLVDNGNIRKVLFYFRDSLGLMVSRAIITRPEIDPVSPKMEELKKKIKAAYPEYYIPPELAPPKVVQSMLEERDQGPKDENSVTEYPPNYSQLRVVSLERRTMSSDVTHIPVREMPVKTTRSGRISRAPERLQLVENSPSMGLYSEDDDSYGEGSSRKLMSSRKTRSIGTVSLVDSNRAQRLNKKLKRSAITTHGNRRYAINNELEHATDSDDSQSKRQRRFWPRNIVHISISDKDSDGLSDSDASEVLLLEQGWRSTKRPSKNECDHAKNSAVRRGQLSTSKAIAKSRLECWQPALTYLQEENGAWRNPTPPKPKTKYNSKSRLPEPITYMQTLDNSAWSFRPFGHGVRPIHARPSRRVEGNPTAEVYDEKVHNGFRPVLMPARRKFGPAVPSKNRLLSATSKEDIPRNLRAKTRKRRLSSALITTSIEPAEYHRQGSGKRTKLQETSHVSVQKSRQTSMVSDIDSQAQNGQEVIREDSVASEYGLSSSFEQSPRPSSNRKRRTKLTPIDPGLDPLAHTLQYRNHNEPLNSLRNNSANSFLNNGFQALRSAEKLKSGTVYMDRSNTFLQRSYSPVLAKVLSHWPENSQEDNEELAGNDCDYEPPGTLKQDARGESHGGRLLTQSMMKSRRLTALPTDVEGIFTPNSGDLDFAVEIAYDHQSNSGVRKRSQAGALTVEVENRIILAVVVVRTLTGGLDKLVDWVLVSRMFPQFPMNFITRRWTEIQHKYKATIERLTTAFQEWFLEVYKCGEVTAIDYDHLLDYNWEKLVDLAGKELKMSVNVETRQIPATRRKLDEMYTLKKTEDNRPWRDDYFGLLQPVYKRMENASSEQYTTPINDVRLNDPDVDDLRIARSWARASILTPNGIYDPVFATEKLASLNTGQVKAATHALLASKVLMQRNKGRATPGRGYEITDTFAGVFRKHLDERQLTQAAEYKSALDDALRANQYVYVEWTANEGQILAITNMQAHGRIRLEPRDVPHNRFGLTDGDYQTKRMDKSRLRFNMQITPTSTYLFNPNLPIPSNCTGSLEPVEPPRGAANAITLWYDISENLMPVMWKKALCALLGTIATRPGAIVKELARLFSPAIEEWEMRLLLDWGVKVGALTPLRDGHEGWNVGEWWWLIGGRAELHGDVPGSDAA